MGNIIIANMQAHLTLDTTQFDQQTQQAEARLAQLEQRGQRLPGIATSNIGQNSQNGQTQEIQQQQVQRAQNTAADNAAHQQAVNNANVRASTEEAGYRKAKAAHQDYVQVFLQGQAQMLAAANATARAVNSIPQVAAPTATQGPPPALQSPTSTGTGIGPTFSGGPAVHPTVPGIMPTAVGAASGVLPVGVPLGPFLPVAEPIQGRPLRTARRPAGTGIGIATNPDDNGYMDEDMLADAEEERKRNAYIAKKQAQTAQSPAYAAAQAQRLAAYDPSKALGYGGGMGSAGEATPDQAGYVPIRPAGMLTADDLTAAEKQLIANNPNLTPDEARAIITPRVGKVAGVAQVAMPAGKGTAKNPASQPSAPGDPADVDDVTTRHGRHPATEGREAETLQYQAYRARGSFGFGLGEAAIGPFGGAQAGNLLLGLASPELGAVAAVGAFTLALKGATDAALKYSQQQFQLAENIQAYGGANALPMQGQGAGVLTPQFQEQQRQRMGGLLFGTQETEQAFNQVAPFAKDQGGVARTLQDAADFARANGIPLNQAIGLFTQLAQGNAGGFQQFMPNIYPEAPQAFVMQQVEQRYGGAAERFLNTPNAAQERLKQDWDDMMLKLGQDFLPVATDITKALDGLVDPFGKFIEGLGAIGRAITYVTGLIPDWVKNTPSKNTMPSVGIPGGSNQLPAPGDLFGMAGFGYNVAAGFVQTLGKPGGPSLNLGPGIGGLPGGTPRSTANPFQPTLPAGVVTNPTPGSPNPSDQTLGSGGLAVEAAAQISAMRQIAQEVQDSGSAIQGVEDVFSKLAQFHVDFSQVQGNLNNLQDSIQFLQKFWVGVAMNAKSGMDINAYQTTKTWLDMVSSMVTLMGSATDVFAKEFMNQGMMPSQAETAQYMIRIEAMFDWANGIAKAALQGQDANLKLDPAFIQGWAASMNGLLTMVSSGADALNKIFNLAVPDQGTINRAMSAIVNMVTAFNVDLVAAFTTSTTSWAGPNQQISTVINTNLQISAAMSDNIGKILQAADAGIDALSKMRNLHIPGPGELKTIIGKVLDMGKQVADAFEGQYKQAAAPEQAFLGTGNIMQMLGMPNVPGMMDMAGADVGPSDKLLNAAGKIADNQLKIMQFVQAGVSALAGMRNLSPPSPGQIKNIINSVFTEANTAIADLPPYDPAQTEKVKNQGEALGAILGAVGSGVSALAAMRDLAEPSQGQIGKAVANIVSIGKSVADALGQQDPQVTDRIRDAGTAYGAIMQFLDTGADVLKKVRDLPEPSTSDIQAFAKGLQTTLDAIMPTATATSQPVGDRARDYGTAMAAVYQGLSTGADWLAKIRDLYVPNQGEVDKFWEAEKHVADMFTKSAQGVGPELARSIEDYGKALQDAFGGMTAGADFLDKALSVPPISNEQIDKYFVMLGEATKEYSAGMDKWVADQDFENAKYSKELNDEVQAMAAGTDFLSKLGQLKPDYSQAIRGYFAQLNYAVLLFNQMLPEWGKSFNDTTDKMAGTVKNEMDAFNSALDPLTKIATASAVRPEQIMLAFRNAKEALHVFSTELVNSPDLAGDKMGQAVQFSRSVTEIFGAMKTTVDAVDVLNQPGYQTNAGTFGQVMNDFFLKAVPDYEQQWIQSMGNMANASKGFANDTLGAIGVLPQASMLPGADKAAIAGARSSAGGGAGSYTNCLIVNGDVIASDPDVANLIMKLTQRQDIKNGGTPVGSGKP